MTWVCPSASKSLSAELPLQPREASLDSISLPFQPYLGTQVRTQMFPRPHQKTKGQEKQSASPSLDVFVVIGGWPVISRFPRPRVRPNKQNEGQSICVCIIVVGSAALASWEKPSLVITGASGFKFPSISLHIVETLVPADRGLQLYTEKRDPGPKQRRAELRVPWLCKTAACEVSKHQGLYRARVSGLGSTTILRAQSRSYFYFSTW